MKQANHNRDVLLFTRRKKTLAIVPQKKADIRVWAEDGTVSRLKVQYISF